MNNTATKRTSRSVSKARQTVKAQAKTGAPVHINKETDEQIATRINERFALVNELTDGITTGDHRAIIISGPPGIGKTVNVTKRLEAYDEEGLGKTFSFDTGYMRPTGIYQRLFEFRHPGQIVVFDDADSVFKEEAGLNLLKAAVDTTPTRNLTWASEYQFAMVNGESVPRRFAFDGAVIFITNLDFDHLIETGDRRAPHLEALMSRAHYVDLGIKTVHDCYIRIRSVVKDEGMLKAHGCTLEQEDTVLEYIRDNKDKLREVSLRMAVKIANSVKAYDGTDRWRSIVDLTCLKKG